MSYSVLFVCLGNICRSPAAENIMNHLLAQRGWGSRVVCDSAGTSAYHLGDPPDRRMSAAVSLRGIAMQGYARQFTTDDFEQFNLILAMDRDNFADISYLDPTGRYTAVFTATAYSLIWRMLDLPGFPGLALYLILGKSEGLLDYITRQPFPVRGDVG